MRPSQEVAAHPPPPSYGARLASQKTPLAECIRPVRRTDSLLSCVFFSQLTCLLAEVFFLQPNASETYAVSVLYRRAPACWMYPIPSQCLDADPRGSRKHRLCSPVVLADAGIDALELLCHRYCEGHGPVGDVDTSPAAQRQPDYRRLRQHRAR